MKIRESLDRHQFLFSALFFAAWMWSSLREKAVGEAVLYSIALAASLFLLVLKLSGWGAKKPEQAAGKGEHQEGMTP